MYKRQFGDHRFGRDPHRGQAPSPGGPRARRHARGARHGVPELSLIHIYDLLAVTTDEDFVQGERELREAGMVDTMLEARVDSVDVYKRQDRQRDDG